MFQNKKELFLFTIILVLFSIFGGCKKERVFKYSPKPNVQVNTNDKRFHENLIHFFKDSVYIIGSNIVIDSGKLFVLDAGTLVKVDPDVSITIQSGASIEAKGTAAEPVIFTSSAERGKAGFRENQGTWKGLSIIGNANNNGSGILTYVRIEFAGVTQSSLVLSAVNNQTTLANIQVSYSFNESSFEFIGGNCNVLNLISYASTGIDFNIHDAYSGKMQNILAYRLPYYANQGGSNLAGLDIEGNNTQPVISNFTVLGPSLLYGINPGYNLGSPQKRAGIITAGGAKFHIRNSFIAGYPQKSFYLDNPSTGISLQSGESEFAYTIINPIDTANPFYMPDNVFPPYTAEDLRSFLLSPQFHNEILQDGSALQLANPYNYFDGIPDPLPGAASPLLTGANFNDTGNVFKDPFFKQVTYRGALGSENWLKGWTNFKPLQTNYNN